MGPKLSDSVRVGIMRASAHPEPVEGSLLPSEVHTHYVGSVFFGNRNLVIACCFVRFGDAFASVNVKLKSEIDRWIYKCSNRRIGNDQMRRNLAE